MKIVKMFSSGRSSAKRSQASLTCPILLVREGFQFSFLVHDHYKVVFALTSEAVMKKHLFS